MIISSSEITSSDLVGAKTKNLLKLVELGLFVPRFVAIPASEIKNCTQERIASMAREIIEALSTESYAVRSSALVEDAAKESYAGQFATRLNVSPQHLPKAISEVIAQARDYLRGDLSKFSLLIQEFIEPDYAGIIFTRNPLGGRELVVEYYEGRGEMVVSGRVKPERLEFYWHQIKPPLEGGRGVFNLRMNPSTPPTPPSRGDFGNLPDLKQALEVAQKIEQHFEHPQDIEWCLKDGTWYWLQTRPITTINKVQYRQSLYLDEIMPHDQKFFYQKTEISEIAPRPTPLTFSLLQKIYSDQGPVSKVYKSYGVIYEAQDFLKILGNELFVDREEELKTLLPSYSYVSSAIGEPQITRISGLGRTLKNIWKITKISGQKSIDTIFENIKKVLEKKEDEASVSDFLQTMLTDYQIIFEINLLAGKAVEKIARLIKNEPITVPALLSSNIVSLDAYQLKIDHDWQGNSLEIADESKFVTHRESENTSDELQKWWENLSTMKKQMLQTVLHEALTYNRFREYGRWLIVKKMQSLRRLVFNKAQKAGFREEKNIYFATIDELISGSISEELCVSRKNKYDKYADVNLPSKISSFVSQNISVVSRGISPGIAQGILVTREMIDQGKYADQPKILHTPVLSPDLTRYFDRIVGIVSESGGILSHLAIIARERKMPVIILDEVIAAEKGDSVLINGEQGTIKKVG